MKVTSLESDFTSRFFTSTNLRLLIFVFRLDGKHVVFGKVVEGMDVLRFCPKYPELLPQFSTVDDILKNAQRYAYALNMNGFSEDFVHADDATLARLDIDDIADHPAVRYLSSTYLPQDNRIRDAWHPDGYPVTNPHVEKRREYVVVGFPAPELWRTPKGLEIFGPKYLGLDSDYVPIEKTHRRR